MRKGLIFTLIGLFALALVPVSQADNNPAIASSHKVQLAYDDGQPINDLPRRDPRRDPGDWIFYDDNNPRFINIGANYWTRVRFTPNQDYRLEQITFRYENPNNVQNPPVTMRVYLDNGQNLGQMVYEANLGTPDPADWFAHDIEEEDQPEFGQGENFSIIYGVAPGGDPNANAQGWWNLMDGSTVTNRSFLVFDNNGNPTGQSFNIDKDFLIRANGTYLVDFFDAAVLEVYNNEGVEEEGAWVLTPGTENNPTEHNLIADLANNGADLLDEEYLINFTVTDWDGEEVFNRDMLGPGIENGDTITVTCDRAWAIPDTASLGKYTVTVTVLVDGDTNAENDQASLDQLVVGFGEDNEVWYGYIDQDYDGRFERSSYRSTDTDGFGVLFPHPGGMEEEVQLRVNKVRFAIDSTGVDLENEVGVGIVDFAANQFRMLWRDHVNVEASNDWQWVEAEIPDSVAGAFVGEGIFAMMFYEMDGQILLDNKVPIAGSSNKLPVTMVTTDDDAQQGINFTSSGDYAVQAMLEWDEGVQIGRRLSVDPTKFDTLKFGFGLARNQDHIQDIMFRGIGTEDVNVNNVLIRNADAEKLSGEVIGADGDLINGFKVEPQDTVYLRMTYHAPDDDDIFETYITVVTDAVNNELNRFRIYIQAGTVIVSVNEHIQQGTPTEWAMSQNYPNPFNPTTTVDFALVKASDITFTVYDMSGRQVQKSLQAQLGAGYHSINVDAKDLPAGIYLYQLKAGEFTATSKMVLVK